MQMEKKLSARHIIGSAADIKKIALGLANDGDRVSLFRVIGLMNRARSVETNFGESIGLRGEFVATRASDGKQFASVELFLPDFATQLVTNAYAGQRAAGGKDDIQVEIALDIGLARRDNLAIGYEYTVEPVQPLQASSPLEALIARTNQAKPLQIAAPVTTASPNASSETTGAGDTSSETKKADEKAAGKKPEGNNKKK